MDQSVDKPFSADDGQESAVLPRTIVDYAEGFEASLRALCQDLTPADFALAEVSAACAAEKWADMRAAAETALGAGISGEALAEVCLQVSIYTGVRSLTSSAQEMAQVAEKMGITLTMAPLADPAQAAESAGRLRRELHGARHDHDHANPGDPLLGPLYALTSHLGYGQIWSRPGLTIRQRFICALSALAITGSEGVLAKFVKSAQDHGFTTDELRQVIMLSALYNGTPRTLRALSALRTQVATAAE